MAVFAVYCIGMTLFSTAMPEIRLTLFLGCIVIIGFLVYPASKQHVRANYLPWYDILLMLVGAGCFFYFALNAMPIIKLGTRIDRCMIVIGIVGILVLVELCRRCVGLPISSWLARLLVYAFYFIVVDAEAMDLMMPCVPSSTSCSTPPTASSARPINVCYTYIVLFIIFGAFLERTGIANFFISFANRIAGWSSGGPAKVAVISLRPVRHGVRLLRRQHRHHRLRHHPHDEEDGLQAGVRRRRRGRGLDRRPDHAAHHGRRRLPDGGVHGHALCEVAVKAILPAILYFTGIFIAVHLEAKKLGLKGIPRDELPKWKLLARTAISSSR